MSPILYFWETSGFEPPESCHSKQTHYQLSHPSTTPKVLSDFLFWLAFSVIGPFLSEFISWPGFKNNFHYHSGIRINFESHGRLSKCCKKLFDEASKRISQCFDRANRYFIVKTKNFKTISTESKPSNKYSSCDTIPLILLTMSRGVIGPFWTLMKNPRFLWKTAVGFSIFQRTLFFRGV